MVIFFNYVANIIFKDENKSSFLVSRSQKVYPIQLYKFIKEELRIIRGIKNTCVFYPLDQGAKK